MNPAFSVGHMKRMIPIFHSVCKQLREVLVADIQKSDREETDVMQYMSRGALELIGQAGFGYTFNVFDGGYHEYSDALKRIM